MVVLHRALLCTAVCVVQAPKLTKKSLNSQFQDPENQYNTPNTVCFCLITFWKKKRLFFSRGGSSRTGETMAALIVV